jgi:hypothetical protein
MAEVYFLKTVKQARHSGARLVIPTLRKLRQEIVTSGQPGLHKEALSQNSNKIKSIQSI